MARRWHHAVLTASALLPLAASALAGPNNGSVVGGAATIQGQGTANVVVNQSTQSAIINWQSFNIGAGETTRIYMPNSSSTQLDRVIGGSPTQILGTLYSNGKVFLVNPDGILFGMGARINVGSLVATTNDITNSDFMAGRYNFTIPGNPNASIVNMGTITAQTGGFAALVAPGVRNTGTITARLGTIALASGNMFTLDMYGDNLITLGINDSISSQVIDVATGKPLKSLVSNAGTLKANGGTVVLTAVEARKIVDSVINNSGVIEANTIGSHKGMIVLGAATGVPNQRVKVSGRLSAAGKRAGTSGGTIQITGGNIKVANATIDASGQAGGGTVLIGGDWGGGKPNTNLVSGNSSAALQPYAVPNANTVSIDAATTIDASAVQTGNGGKVIVWANQATTFLGTILAKGGAQSGNGGFVETSGGTLTYNGSVNTSAANGKTGTWLLDPTDLTIDANGAATISNGLVNNNVVVYTDADGSTSGQGTTSSGPGDIVVDSGISWSSNNTLTLSAYHDIDIAAGITNTAGGSLVLRADSTGTGSGTVTFQGDLGRVNFSQSTGTVSIFYNPTNNPANSEINLTSYKPQETNFRVSTNGEVTDQFTAYMLVNTIYDLQNVENNLSGTYALGKSIDASVTANWNEGAGFMPIGNEDRQFSGIFNGNGNTITNLTINLPSSSDVGLFGYVGTNGLVQNVGLIGGAVVGQNDVGALVGYNSGTVLSSYAATLVTGNSEVGGLVGWNYGTVSQSHASGNVIGTGGDDVGGLVGYNYGGIVTQSYATGNVSGPLDVGGLVGDNSFGTVTQSYASGTVTGTNTYFDFGVGGLVGYMYGGTISQSYASGTVSAPDYVGGLVGWTSGGSISQSYATDAVSGVGYVGGLIGYNNSRVTQTYASGPVTGATPSTTGGLIGLNDGGGTVSASYWDTTIGLTNGYGTNNNSEGFSGRGLTTTDFGMASNFSGWFGENAHWVIVDADGTLNNANGAAGATRPMLLSEWSTTITNPHQLQLMALDLSANYTLANSINLGPALSNPSDVWGPNGNAGFVSIGGNGASSFNGTFNGNGGTISNLSINSASLSYVGLFGQIGGNGIVENVGLSGGSVSGGLSVGALAGGNGGTVTNVYETTAVTAGDLTVLPAGLIGSNFDGGIITLSYATGLVTVGTASSAGGLVGENFGAISQSYAMGAVTGGDNALAGGLVGVNFSTISESHAIGAVEVGDFGSAGGLVGATGLLTVDGNVAANSITNSYATGAVTAGQFSTAGGLVGYNFIGNDHAVRRQRRCNSRRELNSRRSRRRKFHRRLDLKLLRERRSVEHRRQCPTRRPRRRKRPGRNDRQFPSVRRRHVDRQPVAAVHQQQLPRCHLRIRQCGWLCRGQLRHHHRYRLDERPGKLHGLVHLRGRQCLGRRARLRRRLRWL